MKNKLITEIKVGRKFTKNSIFIKNMNNRKRRFK